MNHGVNLFNPCLAVFVALLFPAILFAQPDNAWIRFYGGENTADFYDIYETENGNYAVCGYLTVPDTINGGPAYGQPWLVRTDDNGGEIWTKLIEVNGYGTAYSLIETDDAGLVVGGFQGSPGTDQWDNFLGVKTDNEGNIIWQNTYGEVGSRCFAVIEAKSGNLLFAGQGFTFPGIGYAVMTTPDGEVIWERFYDDLESRAIKSIRESPDGGFYFATRANRQFLIIKTDENGEPEWSESYPAQDGGYGSAWTITSCRGGYTIGGITRLNNDSFYRLIQITGDGQLVWDQSYELDNNPEFSCHTTLFDGTNILVGASDEQFSRAAIVSTDRTGNVEWIRRDRNGDRGPFEIYRSCIEDRHRFPIATGMALNNEGSAIIVKIIPEVSTPQITSFTPQVQDTTILLNDSLMFEVEAFDIQGDSIRYVWRLNDEIVGSDTHWIHCFEDTGTFRICCSVFDEQPGDSAIWMVRVKDLFIACYSPPEPNLRTFHGRSVTFSLDTVRAVEGDPVEYQWTLTNLDNFEREETGAGASATKEFLRSGNYQMEGMAYRGESSDNVIWTIAVRSAILDFWPRELNLSVPPDSSGEFGVIPFNPESDSLSYRWEVDGDSVGSDSTVTLRFEWNGQAGRSTYAVSAIVMDGTEGDTVRWEVTVQDPAEVGKWTSGQVDKWEMLSVSPNPFNSVTKIAFGLPEASQVTIRVFDIAGREVATLVSGNLEAGNHTAVWNAGGFNSGIYLVKMETPSFSDVRKVTLIK